MTAMPTAPLASSSRSMANRLRAASAGSPAGVEVAHGHPAGQWVRPEGQECFPRAGLRLEAQAGGARNGWPAARGWGGFVGMLAEPPSAAPIVARSSPPGRSRRGAAWLRSRRCSPPRPGRRHRPGRGRPSPRSAATWAAVVGLTRPEGLALGAARAAAPPPAAPARWGRECGPRRCPGRRSRPGTRAHRPPAGLGSAAPARRPPLALPAHRSGRWPAPRQDRRRGRSAGCASGGPWRGRRAPPWRRWWRPHPARRRSWSGRRPGRHAAGAVPPRRWPRRSPAG